MSNAHAHGGSCSDSCNVNRRLIRDGGPSFVATVEGDYTIEAGDSFVQVSASDDTDVQEGTLPEVELPSASCFESPHHVTVVGVDTDVTVTGSGTDGEQIVVIPEGKAVTFWIVDAQGDDCDEDTSAYWADDIVAPAP